MTSSEPAEGSFGGAATDSITFTALNWNAPQTVLVDGEDDDIQDGEQPYAISFEVASADENYNAFSVANVDLTNTDDDSAGITVTPGVDESTEAGGQASFTVVLNSEPEQDVTVSFSTSDPAEGLLPGGLDTGSVAFTDLNWNAPQTVLVTGVDDAIQDGDQTYAIVFNDTASTDANYAGRRPANVDLTNRDDDSAGITVTTGVTDSTEAGGTVTFDVVLDSEPTQAVNISMTSSEPAEGLIGGLVSDSISFTGADWDAPQTVTVTGIDDDIQDGDQPYAISFTVTSDDANYGGYSLANVDLTNLDDDSAGISVTVNDSTSTEVGGTASFDVVLDSEPTHPVNILMTSSEPTEGLIGGLVSDSISFTDADWDTPQTVTVTGIDDDVQDGNQPYAISFTVTSSDSNYHGYSVANVGLTNDDDDIAGVSVSVTDGRTDETGGTGTLSVVLTSEPAYPVDIACESADPSEGTVTSGDTLQFTAGDWETAQTVTVTGVDDSIEDGDVSYDINCTASSTDPNYDGEVVTRALINEDDGDTAGVTLSAVTGSTDEAGTLTATFTVVLDTDPDASTQVTCSSGTPAEGQVTGGSPATFDSTDWDLPVTITVTGQDDAVDDGDQSYDVTCTADAAYGNLSDTVSIINADDDVAAIVVSAAAGDTGEDGTPTTFTLVLASDPDASTQVTCSSGTPAEGQVTDGSPATFNSTDWDLPVTITVTGQDDAVDDGDLSYDVTCTADAAYGNLSDTVSITNADDDVAGFVFTGPVGDTDENGTSTTFTVALATQPAGSVNVSCGSDDSTEGLVTSGSPATFGTTGYDSGQTITVTGQDDTSVDGDIAYTVTCTADATYGNLSDTVSITNLDAGVDATVEILQSSFSLGTGITIRVVGDTDEHAASGTVTVTVVTDTAGDSETLTLTEDGGTPGDFDCTVDGCIISTAVATPTAANGVLEASAADTVTVSYTDVRRADNSSNVTVQDTASATTANCAALVINEIVTDPQADWSDSVGGNSTPFDATAGTDTPAAGDEWIEVYNAGTCAVDLTAGGGYDLQMLGSSATYNFASPPGGSALYFPGTSTAANFINGEYLIIGNPTGSGDLLDNGWLRIDEPSSGGIMDEVAFGTSVGGDGSSANNAPAGTAAGASTESIERLPDLTDTDVDNSDWSQTSNNSSIAAANN
jgi:hypothetical protein